MKKNSLYWALGTIVAGAGLFLIGLLWEVRLSSLLCGMGGGLLFNGIVQLWRYIKWTRPENAPLYQERLEQEQIDLRDERKVMLRDRSGRYAYLFGMALCCFSILAFSVLNILEIQVSGLAIVLFLTAYLIVQYAAGIWFYRRLSRRY